MRRGTLGFVSGPVAAVSAGFLVSVVILLISTSDPGRALRAFFVGPFSSAFFLGDLLNTASLLAVAGTGMALAFRAGFFNIGGEGQVYLSGLVAALAAGSLGAWRSDLAPLAVLMVLVAASVTGAFVAGLSGILRAVWKVPELITTFLVSGALVPVVDFLITGPFRDTGGYLLATPAIPEALELERILPPSSLSTIFVPAILVIGLGAFVLYLTRTGFHWRLMGANSTFAALSGAPVARLTIAALAVTGSLYGLTGGLTVLGSAHLAGQGFTAGLGWNAITVALIARNRPLYVPVAALLLAYLQSAAQTAVLRSDMSFQFGAVTQGVVLLLCTIDLASLRPRRAGSRLR